MRRRNDDNIAFEDALSIDWSRDLEVAEVPIGNRPIWYLGIALLAIIAAVGGRIIYLNAAFGRYYEARAEDNMAQYEQAAAPRGVIYDRNGTVIAESKTAFAAVLDTREFINNETLREQTVKAAEDILHLAPEELSRMVNEAGAQDFATPVVLRDNLDQNELVNLQALDLPTIKIQSEFVRDYPHGVLYSGVVGYTGRVTQEDLKADQSLSGSDMIGKTGIESFYDAALRGKPGITVQFKDAHGKILHEEVRSNAQVGSDVRLTLDGDLQLYFSSRLGSGLRSLGRSVGLGIAVDPRNGEVLSLVNLPGFDPNVFSGSAGPGANAEIKRLLTSSDRPLFNRAIDGYYNPGSTIKPLDGVAALAEGVIDPTRTIFSNGFLYVPNPYNSSTPGKYLDWRYQGSVDLSSALAQSSDVYFYVTMGGSPPMSVPLLNDPSDYGVKGLGIARLGDWWKKFGLGTATGIDMPHEAKGFLPTPDWKEAKLGTPWLLGDTYNVSIGQGDLLVSPLQLIDYIAAIGNGGKIYRPFLNSASTPQVAYDLTAYASQIREVQKGMEEGVSAPKGTAYALHDLPVCVAAKTGSAQVRNNEQENALFVGYAPCNHPTIAILILIENSKEGSLNAIPIARDVMNWYYWNRIVGGAKNASSTGQ